MVHQYVSPADKLARQILKTAGKVQPDQALTLPLLEAWFVDETTDAVKEAVAHAVQHGWLTVQDGAWIPSAAGDEIGRRSRAGISKRRRTL